jgi:putative acetyltransferase
VTLAFRPALFPQDGDLLAEIFVRAITELGADYLDDDETAAWVSLADDVAAFTARLQSALTLIASRDGTPAGFIALKDNAVIGMLYVSPDVAGMGVGTALVKAVETLAAHRGAKSLSVDASDMAEALFRKLGYAAQRRNSVDVAGVWLASTTMTKSLAKDDRDTSGRH